MWKQKETGKVSKDMKLFEDQIHPIYKDLYRFIYSIVRSQALAEDALQNTLEKAYKSLQQLKDQGKFKTWIYTIARNETFTLLRKYKRENLAEADNVEINWLFDKEQMLPEEYVSNIEMREYLIEIVNQLKPEFRDIIILRYYADLSLEEISTALNVKINTVKTRHMRAKEKIAKELKKTYLFEYKKQINSTRGRWN